MPEGSQGGGKFERFVRGCQRWLPVLGGLGLIILAITLAIRIMFFPIDIGTEADPNSALVDGSERLIQMVQWTISTVLVVAGALIGINWYRDEQRYKRDREEIDKSLAQLNEIKATVESKINPMLEHVLVTTVEETTYRIADAPEATQKYWILVRGYQRVEQLEKPAMFRTGHLVGNGIRFIARYIEETGERIVVEAGPQEDASDRFLKEVETKFPHLHRSIQGLKDGITYG